MQVGEMAMALLWDGVWFITLFLSIGLSVSFLWKHKTAKAHQILFLALFVSVITPFFSQVARYNQWSLISKSTLERLQSTISIFPSSFTISNLENSNHAIDTNDQSLRSNKNQVNIGKTESLYNFNPTRILFNCFYGVWGLLSCAVLFNFILKLSVEKRILSRTRLVSNSLINQSLVNAIRKLDINIAPKLYESDQIQTPLVYCIWRIPVIVVPTRLTSILRADEWESIFIHELAHWSRRDYMAKVVCLATAVLFPWHPLVVWVSRRLDFLSEITCDQWVLCAGYSPGVYAETLLKILPQKKQNLIGGIGLNSLPILKTRITYILESPVDSVKPSKKWKQWSFISAISLAIIFPLISIQSIQSRNNLFELVKSDMTHSDKLMAGDGKTNHIFGSAIDVDGDTLIVGSFHDDWKAKDGGSAYIYTRKEDQWQQQAKLMVDDIQEHSWFGISVAIDGDTCIVGAQLDSKIAHSAGAAFIFQRIGSRWIHQQSLYPTPGRENDFFGQAVEIQKDIAVVGASRDNDVVQDSGAVYVYKRIGNKWEFMQKLKALDCATKRAFGSSISINGDRILIGSSGTDCVNAEKYKGSAYLFELQNSRFVQKAKLQPSDGNILDYFGVSVALENKRAMIGAYLDDENGERSGSVYVFEQLNNKWCETHKIVSPDALEGQQFGSSVDLHGNVAAIGSVFAFVDDIKSGAVYLYRYDKTEWKLQSTISNSLGKKLNTFGSRVAMNDRTLFVTASRDDEMGKDSGAVYVYDLDKF